MSAENAIQVLATKYGLEEGKTNDWYLCHQTHCLTKKGSEKIRQAEGITFTMPQSIVTDCSIAFTATFSGKDGNTAHEIGSCRWDGSANNPAKTHAPELAWKRLIVRGTIALTAPSQGIYGAEELTAEYKQHGNAAITTSSVPTQGQQPVAAPAQPGSTTYNNGEGMTIPPDGTQGWYEGAESLPQQWSGVMAKLSELTSDDRSKWEMKLIDHLGVFEKSDGENWYPSSKFSSFNHMAGFVSTYDGVTKSKAKYSYRILKLTRELVDEVRDNGSATIKVANFNGGRDDVQILRKDQKQQLSAPQQAIDTASQGVQATVAPKTFTTDDIPF